MADSQPGVNKEMGITVNISIASLWWFLGLWCNRAFCLTPFKESGDLQTITFVGKTLDIDRESFVFYTKA